jgi:sugar-specific transcriptional regulator TrmB
MDATSQRERAVDRLQELGLKEYEAKAYVALSRRDSGTAKQISETSEVPRTRVYDAVNALGSEGLVESRNSNPQQFRAVPVEEAIETLRAEFERRTSELREALDALEPAEDPDETEVTHEVWALSDREAIQSRTRRLVENADSEVVLVLGHEAAFSRGLVETLDAARERGVTVHLGAMDSTLRDAMEAELSDVSVSVSGLEWLTASASPDDDTAISRLLLVDRAAILASSIGVSGSSTDPEYAVYGRGFDNGFVVLVRRLMLTGLLSEPGGLVDD